MADVRIDGHGFGHGAGMAQYGAYGYARMEGRDFRWILDHYYPGTRLAAAPRARLRVRLKEAVALRVTSAASVRGANGRRLSLRTRRTYRFAPWAADQLRVIDLASGRTRAHLIAPARVSPGSSPLKLTGKAENGVTDGRYRGALVLGRAAANVLAIDDVDLEQYLYGVVPSEMPLGLAGRGAERAGRGGPLIRAAQPAPDAAVRRVRRHRSQQYGGVGAEAATTTAAVRATRALAVMTGGEIAQTLFHSSSGGARPPCRRSSTRRRCPTSCRSTIPTTRSRPTTTGAWR